MQTVYFGGAAQDMGYLTPEQVASALNLQEREDSIGRPHRRLGAICVELGYLNDEQVDLIIERVEHQRWLRSSIQGMLLGGPDA